LQSFASKALDVKIPNQRETDINIRGTIYHVGEAVCVDMHQGDPRFGLILKIVQPVASVYQFKVRLLHTEFYGHYHAYRVIEEFEDIIDVEQDNLVSYEPLSIQTNFDGIQFLCPKYTQCR